MMWGEQASKVSFLGALGRNTEGGTVHVFPGIYLVLLLSCCYEEPNPVILGVGTRAQYRNWAEGVRQRGSG